MNPVPWLIGAAGVILCGLLGFLLLLPRIRGIQSTGSKKAILILCGFVQAIIFMASFILAGSTGLLMTFWAALGGGGWAAVIPLLFLLSVALVFVFVVTTGLIGFSAGSNALVIERKSGPFIGAASVIATQILIGFIFWGTGNTLTAPRWGYIDKTGQYVIKPKFEKASEFQNGVAAVQVIENQTKYINKQGEEVPTPKGEVPSFDPFPPTKLSLTDDPTGYEDDGQFSAGRYVIEKNGLELLPFSEGLAAARHADVEPPWGFVDKKFKFVIPEQFRDVRHFKGGCAPAAIEEASNIRWGYIDRKGKWLIKPKFGAARPFSEGLALVAVWDERSRLMYGYIKPNGEFAIQPQYELAGSFSEGLAAVFK